MSVSTSAPTVGHPSPPVVHVHREAVVGFDGRVVGYAITLTDDDTAHGRTPSADPVPVEAWRGPFDPGATPDPLGEDYLQLDLGHLVADRYAFLPLSPAMLDGALPAAAVPGRLVLELPPGFELRPDATRRVAALRHLGADLSLCGYRGGPQQDALLPLLSFVTLDPATVGGPDGPRVDHLGPSLADLVATAHAGGARVLVTEVDPVTAARCRASGVDAVRGGPLHPMPPDGRPRVLRAGQLQCLAALHLLHQPDTDLGQVGGVIDTDPVLTLRVLHLVNSGAFALSREVDTVGQAVVLLGPREITTLVTSLALDARPGAMDSLWRILARALACEELVGEEAGYTVGMLSGLTEELGVPVDLVLEKVGVSAQIGDAIRFQRGDLGVPLAAVLAHERRDFTGVLRLGIAPMRMSEVYLRSLRSALATARAVSV